MREKGGKMDFTGKTTVFTYGTLMKGFPNECVIDSFPHDNYTAVVNNMELYDVGHFPAMVAGKHTYKGELIVFDDSVNKELLYRNMDYLEGYRKNDPAKSLYIREPVTVYVDGEPVETEVYLWNHPTDILSYIDPEKYSGYRDYIER